MGRLLTFLTLIFLASLACAMPVSVVSAVPTPTHNAPKPVVRSTPNALVDAEVTAIEALHVRREPLGTVLGYLYHGDTVILTSTCRDGWAQIEWEGGVAWVKARYLSDNTCKEHP